MMYVLSKNVLTVSNDKVMARLPLLRAHTAQLLEEPLQVQVAQSRELLGPSVQYQWLTPRWMRMWGSGTLQAVYTLKTEALCRVETLE